VAELELGDLFGDIDRLIDAAASTANETTLPKEKALLTAVVEKLRLARKDAAEVVPAKLEELKDLAEGQSALAQQHLADFRAMKQRLAEQAEAMKAAAPSAKTPSPTAAPTAAPDTALGAQLRDELLRRFRPSTGAEPKPFRPGKDIWEDWN
jgi:hypothetical protein